MTEIRLEAADASAEPGPNPSPREHVVRLLYPFWFEPDVLDTAVTALTQHRHAGRKREFEVWREPNRPHEWYREEILPLVTEVLFGRENAACRYLRVPDDTLNYWFPKDGFLEARPQSKQTGRHTTSTAAATSLATQPPSAGHPGHPLTPAGEGIELFLSRHGVGILSLTFRTGKPDELGDLQGGNYRLSQLREHTACRYKSPHDERSPHPPPDGSAPLEQRLGARGGTLTLAELVTFLLAALEPMALRVVQDQFSIYSVTRLDRRALFTNPACQSLLRPFIAALAHVEETTHVGSLNIHERVLNPRHWAAVGSLGAAHLVADQDPAHPFDDQRLSRCLYKYFIPYLCAFLQRLTLQRLLWDTDPAVLEPGGRWKDRLTTLSRLHGAMLSFSVKGYFTEISHREVHNQYYELAQAGLRVSRSLDLVQRALHDMESTAAEHYQQRANEDLHALGRDVGANVGMMAAVQGKVEWLEVFFVSYYATALVHYAGEGFFTASYAHWSVALTPLVSGLIAVLGINPYETHGLTHDGNETRAAETSHAQTKTKPHPHRRSRWFLIGLLIFYGIWFAVGLGWYVKDEPHEIADEATRVHTPSSPIPAHPTAPESPTPPGPGK